MGPERCPYARTARHHGPILRVCPGARLPQRAADAPVPTDDPCGISAVRPATGPSRARLQGCRRARPSVPRPAPRNACKRLAPRSAGLTTGGNSWQHKHCDGSTVRDSCPTGIVSSGALRGSRSIADANTRLADANGQLNAFTPSRSHDLRGPLRDERDRGIGIGAKFHDRVFEAFERLHGARDYEGAHFWIELVAPASLPRAPTGPVRRGPRTGRG